MLPFQMPVILFIHNKKQNVRKNCRCISLVVFFLKGGAQQFHQNQQNTLKEHRKDQDLIGRWDFLDPIVPCHSN